MFLDANVPAKATFTYLRNFSTFSLACLFYFRSEKFRTSVNDKINKRAKKLKNFSSNFADR